MGKRQRHGGLQRAVGEIHLRFGASVAVVLVLVVASNGCDGGGSSGNAGTRTEGAQMTQAASTTPPPATDGDRWGDFVFANIPSAVTVVETPAPVEGAGDDEAIPFDHPGYREFKAPEDLARFVKGRAKVLAPSFVPPGSELLGAWAVETSDGRISDTGVSYRFAGSKQTIHDPDIWIASTFRLRRPTVIDATESVRANGQVRGVPLKVTALGNPAVYLPFDNPPGLGPSLQFRSAVSWFDTDGVFWSVQGRNLDLSTLLQIAGSLDELVAGR